MDTANPEPNGSKITIHKGAPLRSWKPAQAVALLALIAYGLRGTVLNGFLASLDTNRFRGDFSAALFDMNWWCRNGELMDLNYGILFTYLNKAVLTHNSSSCDFTSTYHVDIEQFLFVITGVNVLCAGLAVYLISKLFSLTWFERLFITALWLLDGHLRYSFAVTAFPEFLELILILACLTLMRSEGKSSHVLSGVLLALAVMVKSAPALFIPLLFYPRRYTIQRLSSFIGTITLILLSAMVFLRISIVSIISQLIPVGAISTDHALDTNFRSFSFGLIRIFNLSIDSKTTNVLHAVSVSVLLVILFGTILYTFTSRRFSQHEGLNHDKRYLLLIGLYFSLLPLINIAHGHTFLFLIPAYASIYKAIRDIRAKSKQRIYLLAGILMYLWISLSLLSSLTRRLSIPQLPQIFSEDGVATFGLVLLCAALARNYEIDNRSLRSEDSEDRAF